jgi:ATP-binding cassette subfamily F protein uup
MTLFSASNLSKSFRDKPLFRGVSFGMEQGEKLGLIGRNGAGKSTLLKIIAGIESPDEGEVALNNNLKVEYLTQRTDFEIDDTALNYVLKGKADLYSYFKEYYHLINSKNGNNARIIELSHKIDEQSGWDIEAKAKKYLQMLGITDFSKLLENASGGEKKRIALARIFISEPDLLILDEPTNHLDADTVQWLQDELSQSKISLMFVTHDRYFLDALATKIIEIDFEKLFSYQGNYENYLLQKEMQLANEKSTNEKLQSKLRQELEWLSRGAKARRTKQKSRIDWANKIKDDVRFVEHKNIKIEVGGNFLGSKVIEAHNISYNIQDRILINNFSYNAKAGDRIGIIGANGSGKSTLLKIFNQELEASSGSCKLGSTVKIGYFEQEHLSIDESKTLIGSLQEIAEYINVGVGKERKITVRELLERFLFPRSRHGAYIYTLSGGEKKRIALLRLLMANPNVLLLDEPTNDFDIDTLAVLEEYLDNFYGVLITVSHDRAFLDRAVNFIWAFENNGKIKEYPGNYSTYLEKKELNKKNDNKEIIEKKNEVTTNKHITKSNKLSFKEQKEINEIIDLIPILEEKIKELQEKLSNEFSNYKLIESLSKELNETQEKLDEITLRWLELSEKE